MKKEKLDVIVCPNCGMEYLPAEIFLPDAFVGHPQNIEKDSLGKVCSFSGLSSDTAEEYVCDGCKSLFRVSARVNYMTTIRDKFNFNTDHTTKLKKTTLSLKEN